MDPGSIGGVTARLKTWCVQWDRGLARVEWDSAFARRDVVDRLKESLGGLGIPLVEIALPPGETGHETVLGLLEKLRSAGDSVASITDLEWAFPEHGSQLETLAALSFRREALAALPVRQIWWMPSTLAERFVVGVPDLDSWFQLRLHLTEVPARRAGPFREMQVGEILAVSVEEARAVAKRFWERLDAARARNFPEERIWTELAQPAVDALRAAGLDQEAMDVLARMPDSRGDLEHRLQDLIETRGSDDPEVLSVSEELARVLGRQGDYSAARLLQERVLERRTQVLGEEHSGTLAAMLNLATTLWLQGDYAGARQFEERALEVRKRVLGEENPSTLRAMNNLALTLQDLGEYPAARRLQDRVLEIRTRISGSESPETLRAMNNLTTTLHAVGDYSAARLLGERVLGIATRVLGAEHPETLRLMNNLAATLRSQGDYEAARPLQERVLAASTRVLGAEHPDTLTAMGNLAHSLFEAGSAEEALLLLRKCLAARCKVLGENHPDTVATAKLLENWEAQSQVGHPTGS